MKLKFNVNNMFFLFIIFISAPNLSGIKIVNNSNRDLQIRIKSKSKFITIPKHSFENINLNLLRDLQKNLQKCPIQNLQQIKTSHDILTIQNIQNALPFNLVYKFQGYNKLKSKIIGSREFAFEKIEFSQLTLAKYLKSLEPKTKFKNKEKTRINTNTKTAKTNLETAKTDAEFLDNIFGEYPSKNFEEDDLEILEEASYEWYMREASVKEKPKQLEYKNLEIIKDKSIGEYEDENEIENNSEDSDDYIDKEIEKLSESVIFPESEPNISSTNNLESNFNKKVVELVDITEEFKQNLSPSKVIYPQAIGSLPIFIEDSENNSIEHIENQTIKDKTQIYQENNKQNILKKAKTNNNNYLKKTILTALAITTGYISYKYYNKYYKKHHKSIAN